MARWFIYSIIALSASKSPEKLGGFFCLYTLGYLFPSWTYSTPDQSIKRQFKNFELKFIYIELAFEVYFCIFILNWSKSDSYENDANEILSPESQNASLTCGYLFRGLLCNQIHCWILKLKAHRKNRSIMPVKGYYQRAKVFGYLIIAVALATLIYYLFQYLVN